ncbi:MAG: hypothetical protein V9H26_03350 [Verrucomicrobiota bacterium]
MLAERVLRLETALYQPEFAAWPPDERLAAEFHRRICHDLVPVWAGAWRTIEVRVGNSDPATAPSSAGAHAELRRRSGGPLALWRPLLRAISRWNCLPLPRAGFLSIHPFRDFNGRTIRLFLLELLRRLDLPRVVLAPESEPERQAYFRALEAADRSDWQPLMAIWATTVSRPLRKPHETVSHPIGNLRADGLMDAP